MSKDKGEIMSKEAIMTLGENSNGRKSRFQMINYEFSVAGGQRSVTS